MIQLLWGGLNYSQNDKKSRTSNFLESNFYTQLIRATTFKTYIGKGASAINVTRLPYCDLDETGLRRISITILTKFVALDLSFT